MQSDKNEVTVNLTALAEFIIHLQAEAKKKLQANAANTRTEPRSMTISAPNESNLSDDVSSYSKCVVAVPPFLAEEEPIYHIQRSAVQSTLNGSGSEYSA